MGGIGKTTLASAVFQKLSNFQFEGCSFISNVREEYQRHGLTHLRKMLLYELLNDKSILKMDTPFVGSSFVLDKLRRKKVLVVLDDVDSSMKLDALLEGCDQFASGSRIIVTTRDVQVLKKVADKIYKVERLSYIESLELFGLHAFGKNSPPIDDKILLRKVVSYADGNPLALKVLGSFLNSKSKEEWEIALNKLKIFPNKDILNALRISFDGLDDKGIQDIFLDIACLFKGSFSRCHAESILDVGDSFVKLGITLLIDKCLIESKETHEGCMLRMHDLLRQMGQTIVCDEHKEPGNHSRLWDVKDVCHALERNTGTAAVEGISLNLCEVNRDIKVCHAAFSKMSNLRVLKIYCDNIGDSKFKLFLSQGLDSYLSEKLRYFQWDLYPLKSLPSNLDLRNLVELILRGSHLQKLWDQKLQSLLVLRWMDLSYSKFLTELPDLSQLAPNLESINLEGCTSLLQVLSSVQNLQKLNCLNLNSCSKLRDFSEETSGFLNLARFGGIKNFLGNIFFRRFTNNLSSSCNFSQKSLPMSLTVLHLGGTPIEELPSSICYLSGLVDLDLGDCKDLLRVSTSICKLKSLEKLNLSGCLKLEKFPEILEPMVKLITLILDGAAIKELPDSIEKLSSLEILEANGCKDIEFLPKNLCALTKLHGMFLDSCSKLQNLSFIPPDLRFLHVNYCESLISLPELPLSMNVEARYCTSLEKISNWRASLQHDQLADLIDDPSFLERKINFCGCQKLEHNNILAEQAVLRIILYCADFNNTIERTINIDTCYPGDEIPNWFNYQTLGNSMSGIMLPPNWNSDKFLGLAVCVVLGRNYSKIETSVKVSIYFVLNFFETTVDDGDNDHFGPSYEFQEYLFLEELMMTNSDHVVMSYFNKPSLQKSRGMHGLNWPSNCSMGASLGVWPTFFDDGTSYAHLEIKNCGIRLVYEEDVEAYLVETTSKKKRTRFDECCEASGSGGKGVRPDEEDDVSHHMINSKKLKL